MILSPAALWQPQTPVQTLITVFCVCVVREDVIVATKVAGPSGTMEWIRGGPSSLDASNITQAIDSSLRRLQTDYIDLYQIHWPDRWEPRQMVWTGACDD